MPSHHPLRVAACSLVIVALVLGLAGCANPDDRAETKMEDACRQWTNIYKAGPFALLTAPTAARKAASEAASAVQLDPRWLPLSRDMTNVVVLEAAVAA